MRIWAGPLLAMLLMVAPSADANKLTSTPPPPVLEDLLPRANNGDAEAELALGWAFYWGNYVSHGQAGHRDIAEARTWFARAAAHGNAEAQTTLDDINRDQAAMQAAREKAAGGDPQALYEFADLSCGGGQLVVDVAESCYELMLKAAEKGSAPAQARVARQLEQSEEGAPFDILAAIGWYKKAADQGDAFAFKRYYELRAVYHEYELHRDAAMTGDPRAQYAFGRLIDSLAYFKFAQYSPAYDWYKKAAAQNHPDAMFEVARITDIARDRHARGVTELDPDFRDDRLDITQDEVMALYKASALAGSRPGAWVMAMHDAQADAVDQAQVYAWLDRAGPDYKTCYLYYRGVLTRDGGVYGGYIPQPLSYEKLARFKGTPQPRKAFACYQALARIYDTADATDRDWLADEAHYFMGYMYLRGEAVAKNETKALAQFAQVQNLHWPVAAQAQLELARIYEAGRVVPRDRVKAYVVLNHALRVLGYRPRDKRSDDPRIEALAQEDEIAAWALWDEISRLRPILTPEEITTANTQLRDLYNDRPVDRWEMEQP